MQAEVKEQRKEEKSDRRNVNHFIPCKNPGWKEHISDYYTNYGFEYMTVIKQGTGVPFQIAHNSSIFHASRL
jgi:hypothetical protein